MSTRVEARPAPTDVAAGPAPTSSPFRAAFALSWRLIRRGSLLLWLSVATYLVVKVVSFRVAYPDQASRQKLLDLSGAAAVRMLQGIPGAVDHVGGFAVWDGGWMLALIVATWSLLTATRLTRGEEDAGRAELVLSRPLTPQQALGASLAALALGLLGVGAAAAVPFIVLGEPVSGALLWGAGLAGFGAVIGGLGAVCSQVLDLRRRAVSLGLALIAAAFLVRVIANSADERRWLLTLTPFGWIDRLQAFSADQWPRLAYPLLTAPALAALALVACSRRDTGAALLRGQVARRSRLHLLGGASAFGWRCTSSALVAWATTLAISNLVFGLMAGAIVDFINEDDTYRRLLESMGLDMSSPVIGFVSYVADFMALPFAAYVAWRIGAARQEEADGRLDNLLVRGVVRWRWLTATTALALTTALVVVLASATGFWIGSALAHGGVAMGDVLQAMAGTVPLVVLVLGVSVLTFAAAPRLTVGVPVTLTVVAYLLDTFGTLLAWPHAVLALSPFHHLARLPGAPMTAPAVVVMTVLGALAAAAGVAVFARRDLQGA